MKHLPIAEQIRQTVESGGSAAQVQELIEELAPLGPECPHRQADRERCRDRLTELRAIHARITR